MLRLLLRGSSPKTKVYIFYFLIYNLQYTNHKITCLSPFLFAENKLWAGGKRGGVQCFQLLSVQHNGVCWQVFTCIVVYFSEGAYHQIQILFLQSKSTQGCSCSFTLMLRGIEVCREEDYLLENKDEIA
jgi:hypothetical protein